MKKNMKHYYVREWNQGLAVHAKTGKDRCKLHRFDSRIMADAYAVEYSAPNYCPTAFAERISAKEARQYAPRVNAFGDEIGHWMRSDCGHYETAL